MKQRVLGALAFGPLALLAAWSGGTLLLVAVALLVGYGYRELSALLRRRDIHMIPGVAQGGLAVLVLAAHGAPGELWAAAVVASLVAPLVVLVTHPGTYTLQEVATTSLACAYLGGLSGFLLRLRRLGDAWPLLLTLFLTWAYDVGGYFSGRAWGRRKLAPAVSPGKTWEGAAGGLVSSLVVAAALARPAGLSYLTALGAATLAAVLAQLGDLAESAIKRFAGAKDAGSLIPGHGGILDRCDGLLWVGLGLYIYLMVVPG